MDGDIQKEENTRDEIFSKSVRAGKRTYFFDVKKTRKEEFYLTITESKKRFDENGGFFFEKHKLFLYKEDFDKFIDAYNEVADFIYNADSNTETLEHHETDEVLTEVNFTQLEFEDLER